MEQPDYLVLNNPCGQLSLYASPDPDEDPPYAMGLYEWAVGRGYRWVGYECRIGTDGRADPAHRLPAPPADGRVPGLVLRHAAGRRPPNLEVVRHYAAATDISPEIGGRETVLLDNGDDDQRRPCGAHLGAHLERRAGGRATDVRYLRPYPVEYFDIPLPPGAPIAIAGMGLVGFDLLTALTVGRGGTYEEVGDRLVYRPSGDEPDIYLYSRSGVPYCAKSAHGVDPYGDYQPVVCTPEAFSELTHPAGSTFRRHVDFRHDLLPLLLAEMQARYYTHAAYLKGGIDASTAARAQLRAGWLAGSYDRAVEQLEPIYGRFDPAAMCSPTPDAATRQPRVPVPRVRDGRDRPRRGPRRRRQPGQGGAGGTAHPPRPVALGHRVRRALPRVLHRLPVQRPRSHQPARGRPAAAPVPAAARRSSMPERSGSRSAPTRSSWRPRTVG